MLVASHRSRHRLLTGQLDASIIDEIDPGKREPALNLYDPANPAQPPYSTDFLSAYRQAQVARNRKISAFAREKLAALKAAGDEHEEYCFIVHGTMADPRWIDPTVDPNQRRPNWTYLGDPAVVNNSASGLARFNSLRGWLSQWSLDDAQFNSADECQAALGNEDPIEGEAGKAGRAQHPCQVEAGCGGDAAEPAARGHPCGDHRGDRLAVPFGARLSGRRGAQGSG